MISDAMPPWIYPTVSVVKVFDKNKNGYIEGYYCFETQTWKNTKGVKIVTTGWKYK